MEKRGQEVKYLKRGDLKKIREYLKKKNKIQLLGFVNIGVNVALRISDLRDLRFEEVINGKLVIKEKKTGKRRNIALNSVVLENLEMLKKYYSDMGFSVDSGYIFKSLSPYNRKMMIDSPFTNSGVAKEFNKISLVLDIPYPIGSHSLRKTWGHMAYKKTNDIALIMKALNHSSVDQTLKYIGIEEENLDDLYHLIIV